MRRLDECWNVSYAALKTNTDTQTHTHTHRLYDWNVQAGSRFVSMIDFSTGRTTHSLPRVSMERDVTNTISFSLSFSLSFFDSSTFSAVLNPSF